MRTFMLLKANRSIIIAFLYTTVSLISSASILEYLIKSEVISVPKMFALLIEII